jgi:hypothetical protein
MYGHYSNQHHADDDGRSSWCGKSDRKKRTADRFTQRRHERMSPTRWKTKDGEELPRGV